MGNMKYLKSVIGKNIIVIFSGSICVSQ